MGYIQHGIPKQLLLKFVAAAKIPNFVETGTYLGASAFWAAEYFERVFTLEIDPVLSQAAAATPGRPANIEFWVGNSGQLLSSVIEKLKGAAVFWLDGHYSGPGTGGEGAECPVMEELSALTKATEPLILIDDARCFQGPLPPPSDPSHWPSLETIFKYLFEHFPSHYNTLVDDVIISVPRALRPILDADWQEHYDERFPPALSLDQRIQGYLKRMLRGGVK